MLTSQARDEPASSGSPISFYCFSVLAKPLDLPENSWNLDYLYVTTLEALIFFFSKKVIIETGEETKQLDTEDSYAPIFDSCPKQLGFSQAQARNSELNLSVSPGWQLLEPLPTASQGVRQNWKNSHDLIPNTQYGMWAFPAQSHQARCPLPAFFTVSGDR